MRPKDVAPLIFDISKRKRCVVRKVWHMCLHVQPVRKCPSYILNTLLLEVLVIVVHIERLARVDNSPSSTCSPSLSDSLRLFLYKSCQERKSSISNLRLLAEGLDLSRIGSPIMEGPIPISSNTRIAVVTGGNKGMGLEVCKQLAGSGITVVLTARDETRGTAAVEQIKQLGHLDVIFHQLDITDAASIAQLTDFLNTHFQKLDILVNNAGTAGFEHLPGGETKQFDCMDGYQKIELIRNTSRETYETAKQGVQTNYYATKEVTEALLPLLQSSSDGRIVNVSSNFGLLSLFRNEELKQELNAIDSLTEERLDELLDMFMIDFEAGEVDARGWPAEFSAYKVAKAALNAYSRILAKRHPELRVNCVHPGYVRTDMTRNSGFLTAEEGAYNITSVVLLLKDGPTGTYFHEGTQASFV